MINSKKILLVTLSLLNVALSAHADIPLSERAVKEDRPPLLQGQPAEPEILGVNPSNIEVSQGGNQSVKINTSVLDELVTLSLENPPSGVTLRDSLGNILGSSGGSKVDPKTGEPLDQFKIVEIDENVPTGTYELAIKVQFPNQFLNKKLKLENNVEFLDLTLQVVAAPAKFSIEGPDSFGVNQYGKSFSLPFTINHAGNFYEPVKISLENVPNGVRGVFTKDTVSQDCNETKLLISVDRFVKPGIYNLFVTGEGGNQVHSAPFTLTVVDSSIVIGSESFGLNALDTSFGFMGDGMALPVTQGGASAMALRPNGRIIAGNGKRLFRFDGIGLKTSILVKILNGGDTTELKDLAVRDNGKIVSLSTRPLNSTIVTASSGLQSFNVDGSKDIDFSNNGRFNLPGDDISANTLVLLDDDKLLVGGTSKRSDNRIIYTKGGTQGSGANGSSASSFDTDFIVFRLTPGGNLDPDFDDDGIVTIPVGSGDTFGDMVVDHQGRIVMVGVNSGGSVFLVRVDKNGAYDPTFGANGIIVSNISANSSDSLKLNIDAQGRLVVAGSIGSGDSSDFTVARFNIDGTPDTGFGIDGNDTVTIDFVGRGDTARAVVVQDDGKIVVAGQARVQLSSDFSDVTHNFALLRLEEQGSLDLSFGESGKVLIGLGDLSDVFFPGVYDTTGSFDETFTDLAITDDGKIQAAGKAGRGVALMRFNP